MTDVNEGLKKLAEDLRLMGPARYCAEHKPCDAKEHQLGYRIVLTAFMVVAGSLVYGLGLMIGVNTVLADWLEVVPTVDYWTAVAGTASLFMLRAIAKL